ncbi:MAG: hypothetical protein LBT89_08990 [Planctomycetaceae bacterium]|jgi:hypothetical protein|nr:hypothetical protein [Planctomycetaceae bacterium]
MPKRIGTYLLISTAALAGAVLSFVGQEFMPHTAYGQFPAPPVLQQELPRNCRNTCAVDFTAFEDPMNPARKIRVITVVETEAKKIAVYHEELASGKVWLMSVRDIKPDLQIDQFNASPPLPSDVGKEVQRLKNK